ncbi:MAG: ADYC domain-containing protein [Pseudomonadota bacterium]
MKTTTTRLVLVVALMICTLGCAVEAPQQPVERQEQALLFWKPYLIKLAFELVGHGLNGISLNGQPQDAHLVVAVSLEGVQLENGEAEDLQLKRTRFYAPTKKKKAGKLKELKHKKLEEAQFTGYLEDGTEVLLRIEGSREIKDLPETYLAYAVTFQADAGWTPLCGLDAQTGEPIHAVPLNGTWEYQEGAEDAGAWAANDGLFTFGCEGFVLAKCVALGYTPWSQGQICDTEAPGDDCVEATLASRHQACTRALRADYCGDGTSHTVGGVLLNLYDGIGIRADGEDWDLEAEWDADGARCAVAARIPALPAPPCIDALALPDCGDPAHFEEETLLFTEIETPDSP